jgi:hypothetical protein
LLYGFGGHGLIDVSTSELTIPNFFPSIFRIRTIRVPKLGSNPSRLAANAADGIDRDRANARTAAIAALDTRRLIYTLLAVRSFKSI